MPDTDPAYVAQVDRQADEHVLQERYEEVRARVAANDCVCCGAHAYRCDCPQDAIEATLSEVF